jgi:hypothetical protein
MNLLAIWNAIPSGLKKFVGYGISAGIALVMVVFAFLSFPFLTDFIKDKLGMPTRADVSNVANAVQVNSEDQVNAAIQFTAGAMIESAQERMRNENDSLFSEVTTSLIQPGIKRLRALEENVRLLNERVGVSMQVQRDESRQTRERIGDLKSELNNDELVELMRALQQQMNELQDQVEETRPKTRNTKQKF